MPTRKGNGWKKDELDLFKKNLTTRRQMLAGDVTRMEGSALRNSRQDASGDLSNMPLHMADIGSDNFEQEFTLELLENEEDELREIDAALERIGEDLYGMCELCEKKIPKARLLAIPYARLCIECKKADEGGTRKK